MDRRSHVMRREYAYGGDIISAGGSESSVDRKSSPTELPVADLLPADSPRLEGEDLEHVRLLAANRAALPAILVHRSTMRVVDGMHRLRAAIMRGQRTVMVEFFDGTEAEAFIHAVRANVTHGLPLSRQDREAAAARIIQTQGHWSDRLIADASGLSAPTIALIRERTTDSSSQLNKRMGRDGRVRPLDNWEGRQRAGEVVRECPEASLRQIAQSAGISIGTARDVRNRMRRGESPTLDRSVRTAPRLASPALPPSQPQGVSLDRDLAVLLLRNLRQDPSLRFTDIGRSVLQWFGVYALGEGDEQSLVRSLPEHCRPRLAQLAWGSAEIWRRLAQELEEQSL